MASLRGKFELLLETAVDGVPPDLRDDFESIFAHIERSADLIRQSWSRLEGTSEEALGMTLGEKRRRDWWWGERQRWTLIDWCNLLVRLYSSPLLCFLWFFIHRTPYLALHHSTHLSALTTYPPSPLHPCLYRSQGTNKGATAFPSTYLRLSQRQQLPPLLYWDHPSVFRHQISAPH